MSRDHSFPAVLAWRGLEPIVPGLLLNLLLRVAIGAAATYAAMRLLGASWPVVAVIWGALLARPVIEFFPALVRSARHAALREWEGRYYAFESAQVRVIEVDGAPWIVDADAFRALGVRTTRRTRAVLAATFGPADYAPIPGTPHRGFSERGVLRYLERREDRQATKFRLWLEREVFGPWRQRRERAHSGAIIAADSPDRG